MLQLDRLHDLATYRIYTFSSWITLCIYDIIITNQYMFQFSSDLSLLKKNKKMIVLIYTCYASSE